MEQRMENLEIAHQGASNLAKRRAMEKQAQRPQMLDDEIRGPANTIKGGGEAGLARVVGAGKRRGRPPKEVKMEVEEMPESESEEEMSGGRMCGGASHQGKMLRDHLMKLHGKGFVEDFAKGLMMMRGKGDKRISEPQGTEITHAGFSQGQMTPGAVAPVAYGSPPQAPASFQRNTVGMGKLTITHGEEMKGKGKLSITHGGRRRNAVVEPVEVPKEVKGGGKRSARGALVSKLMKEKGMSLAEASRYIKEKSLL